jgi:hypothetical protein
MSRELCRFNPADRAPALAEAPFDQAIALLVHAASSFFAVPLAVRIHEGLVWSNRDKRTLLDKMLV